MYFVSDAKGSIWMGGSRWRQMRRREVRALKRETATLRILGGGACHSDASPKVGRAFGYPPCCIDAFVASTSAPSAFDGTGFRTCVACAARPYAEVWRGIHARRSVSWPLCPFPARR